MIAKVLVDVKARNVNKLFDYEIPDQYKQMIKKGMRVVVPFGKQKRLGYVIDFTEKSKYSTRPIIEVLDIIPSIDEELFMYIDFLLETNKRLYINAIETILPSELFLKYNKKVILIKKEGVRSEFQKLFKNNEAILNKSFLGYEKDLYNYLEKGYIKIINEYEQKGREKLIKAIYCNKEYNYKNAIRYIDLISYVQDNPGFRRVDLIKKGYNSSAIDTLIRNEVFYVKEEVSLREVDFLKTSKIPLHTLNKDQKYVLDKIKNNIETYKTYLLHGITGSGKTEIYMHLIKEVLKNNKKVLYLVPEITQIAPVVNYIKSRFDVEIAHYNSNLSSGERYDSYQKIINDKADIVIGTRSSVFLPIKNLGIIIMDEEHDQSYIQTENVQYNTKDIANIKSKYFNIPLILGSATPSVESMYMAKNGEYELLELKNRATNQPLPKIHFVDMKEELKKGNTKIFSDILYNKIKDRLNKKEQIILLFNRKGMAPFVMCRSCGFTPKCPNCDVSLTLFKNNKLKCRYCGYYEENYSKCPTCKMSTIKSVGVGIEHIELQVKKHFKNARVIRMDATTTTKKGSHEKIWLDFKNLKYDILVGTQMISKGLDFPNVTLVGVLMADLSLNIPSYLASEQAYSLLSQTTGRSGRTKYGEAVIQGYNLDHYSIEAVEKGYDYFYKNAIYERKILKYSPFYQVVQILVMGDSYFESYKIAFQIKKDLEEKFDIILGPAEPIVRYIKKKYRFFITIKDKKINQEIIFNIIKKYEDEIDIYYYAIPEII